MRKSMSARYQKYSDGHCPPGKSKSIETSVNSFLIDCSQLDLDLRQVSKGPSYEMSSNMTRPATDKALSVTIVSHILQHNNSKLISEKLKR